jgi:hypothetical protein
VQQQQGAGELDDWDAYLAHSVGFAEMHNMGQLQAMHKQQQQVRQAVTSAAQLRQATSAEIGVDGSSSSSRVGGQSLLSSAAADQASSSSSARSSRVGQQQQQLQQRQQQEAEDEDAHTLTMMPVRENSWANKRSLAGVLDLFDDAGMEAQQQQQQPAMAAASGAAAAAAAWFDPDGDAAAGAGGGTRGSRREQ